jgi:hypothetical protein
MDGDEGERNRLKGKIEAFHIRNGKGRGED